MEGELIAYHSVWFGIREPEWWPEDLDDDEFEDRISFEKNLRKKPIRILRK
jgi:hypothetical protein